MKLYNFQNHRIGDKIAASQQLQFYKKTQGLKYLIIDSITGFQIKRFFPDITDYLIESNNNEIVEELKDKDWLSFGNLWISSTNLFKNMNYSPKMTVPNDLRFKLEQAYLELPDKTNKPIKEFKIKIVSHCLTDAPYNKGRNMNEVQYKELLNQVSLYCTKENIDYTIITIPTDYSMSVEDCIGLIDIADIYIGGDTGFTHCAAALDKDIVAIYGNNEHDVKAFEPEKIKGGFKYDWSSDPLTNKYRKFELKNNLFNIEEVLFYVIDKIKEKNKNG